MTMEEYLVQYKGYIMQLVRKYGGTKSDNIAKDAIQNVYVHCLTHEENFIRYGYPFKAWIHFVVRYILQQTRRDANVVYVPLMQKGASDITKQFAVEARCISSLVDDSDEDNWDTGGNIFDIADTAPNPEEILLEKEQNELKKQEGNLKNIHSFIKKLTPKHRNIVEEYFFNEKNLQEIGDEIGVSRQAVHQTLHTALRKLRKMLIT